MAMPGKRGRSPSPPATAIISTISSLSPAATSSTLSYFLPELIPLIASRLTSLQDFFALRAACRTYRALLQPSPSNLASQAPLLLFPHKKPPSSDALFHLSLRRVIRSRLPFPRTEASVIRFSFGCRVVIHDSIFLRRKLHIVDLLTGEVALLPDPPYHFDRAIFSGDLVVTFLIESRELRYCRTGDDQWRVASYDEAYRLKSLIFVKRTLYALVNPGCRLAAVKLSDNDSAELSFLGGAQTVNENSFCFLAECQGELLLLRDVSFYPRTRGYHVFRWRSGEEKWERTTTLGGCSLFFNIYHQFAGCLGSDHPAVRRDCIYVTELNRPKWIEYSLVDGSFRELVADFPAGGEGTRRAYGIPVWVLPSIC